MRRVFVMCGLVLSFAGVAMAGLSGTYSVKPQGGGDFASLYSVYEALTSQGMSGNCVFRLDSGDYSHDAFYEDLASGEEFLLTFRAATGQHVIIDGDHFSLGGSRVELDGIEFGPSLCVSHAEWSIYVHGCTFLCELHVTGGSGHVITGNHFAFLYLQNPNSAVVANNVFMETDESWLWGALVIEAVEESAKVYYNTFYRSPSSHDVSCCWIDGTSFDLRNNVYAVLYDGAHGALCCEPSYNPLPTSDYNCYWTVAPVPIVCDEIAGDSFTLAEWQALGYDAHGLNADPMVTGGGDPHLLEGSPCIGAGVPIPGFEYDIDGDPRDPVHPAIGCDEFTGAGVAEAGHRVPVATLSVVPNPTSGGATVSARAVVVDVFDAMGRLVRRLALNSGRATISGLAPGVYVLRAGTASAKLTVTD